MKTYLTTNGNFITSPLIESHLKTFKDEEKPQLTAAEIYDAVFRSAFHAMFFANKEGDIIRFNEKFCKLFRYSETAMLTIQRPNILAINEKAFRDFMAQRNDKGIASAEITGIRKSGKRFPCRISSVIYHSDYGHKRILNTLVDISDDLSARWNIGG